MIYKNEPENFKAKFEVVSCYIECDGEILILHRQDHKPEGDTWGLPAGKIDKGENEFSAILREVKEETGISIKSEDLIYLSKLYIAYPNFNFVFYSFKVFLEDKPIVIINKKEHKDYKWLSPEEVLKLNLIPDFDECLKMSYNL